VTAPSEKFLRAEAPSWDTEEALPGEHAGTTSLAADHARVTQALRDVRHLLPPDGIAIVDAALAGAGAGPGAALFEPGVEAAWTWTRRFD
jgi:hypothetical protein